MSETAATDDQRRVVEVEDECSTVRTDEGRTIAYAEYGTPGGAPVVFFHGTPGSGVLGELFHSAARESDVRVLAIDRPGYGRSDGWSGRTLADTERFVLPVLDDAGVASAKVVGFSGGGPHALALAATSPERVEAVDLVSASPPPSLVEGTPRTVRVLEILANRVPWLLRGSVRAQAWLAARTSPALVVSQYTSNGGADVPGPVAEVVRRDFVAAVAGRGEGLVTESRLLHGEWDVSPGDVDAPVRIWHGDADANVPLDSAHRLADALPNAELTILEDADHLNALLECRTDVLSDY
ncbi:Pimeloyl-ACP methyl ester carboxylesterase [Halomicrobium zhouii]|uniref:Pimeloyl-ACP methyl ester carboxylesterase n=1 Tax=Halomicrobium zhouii TaxID=767519 RepID=A0A1I6LEH3_9EURY|nr:alpha/beta hydrolase [Halomicrobium zhouii]SFS01855.1 Pimeloyl-ACP methyl ester carboxylesterase [Halomicrobium zhouii]